MERRLGRGLGALLPESSRSKAPLELELDAIRPNPHQPRQVFRPDGLEELRQSIVNHGVLQPVVVRKMGSSYELVSGERRWRASRLAGCRTIPVIVRQNVSDDDMLELALVENVQRRNLDPMEKARGFKQMVDQLELTQEKVAGRVGINRSSVANHIRLLELPDSIQEAVSMGTLSMGHAKALLALKDRNRLMELATDTMNGNLSVREVERLVRESSEPATEEAEPVPDSDSSTSASSSDTLIPRAPWIADLEARMQEFLGTKVRLKNGDNYKGQVVIDYFGREELERLISKLTDDSSI
ncbi:MAG: ParB family chromosome partitioning protein [Planctomycetota bacterium]|jgi:ParB family chromosome partitioning protein